MPAAAKRTVGKRHSSSHQQHASTEALHQPRRASDPAPTFDPLPSSRVIRRDWDASSSPLPEPTLPRAGEPDERSPLLGTSSGYAAELDRICVGRAGGARLDEETPAAARKGQLVGPPTPRLTGHGAGFLMSLVTKAPGRRSWHVSLGGRCARRGAASECFRA